MIKSFLKQFFYMICCLLLPSFSWAFECGNNFEAKFNLTEIRSPQLNTAVISAPLGSELVTNLELKAIGEGLNEVGRNVDVVIVMDRSGSMNLEFNDVVKIEQAKKAVAGIVDSMYSFEDSANRLALVSYSSSVTLDQVLTNNYQSVQDKADHLSAGGTTNLGGALQVAADHLEDNGREDSKKIIIIASDGLPNGGLPVPEGIESVSDDITVFSVGIGGDVDATIMQEIASAGTGEGSYYYSNVSDLAEVFRMIIEGIYKPFEVGTVDLKFFRDQANLDKFPLESVNPVQDSLNGNEIFWGNLGSMSKDQAINFEMIYKQSAGFGTELFLNQDFIEVSYSFLGVDCTDRIPIEKIVIENAPVCLGAVPILADLCSGDEDNLSSNKERTLVDSCTASNKCEYVCQTPFERSGDKCVLDARCGSLSRSSWCKELPNEGDLCSVGDSTSPILIADSWRWECQSLYGGASVNCSASRSCGRGWIEVNP